MAIDQITTGVIKDNAVTSAKIPAGAIEIADVADDAITSALIADDAVVTASVADSAITTALIAADSVTGAKIADDAINSEHYTVCSIDTAHIADNNVTAAKIFDLARGSILYGNASAATAELTKGSANTVLTSDGTDISWAAAGGGLEKAVIYRLTSSFTGDQDPISSNLEKDDTRGDSTLGDSLVLNESSGVFDFAGPSSNGPGTGTYLIQAPALFGNGAADPETNLIIEVATDGSTFEQASTSQGSVYNSSARSVLTASYIFQVTNTSNDKVQFKISGNSGSNTIFGDTSINYTYFTFIKLA